MTTNEFKILVEKYRLGECSLEEIHFVEKWMSINGINTHDEISVFKNIIEEDILQEEIWSGIQEKLGIKRKVVAKKVPRYWLLAGVAAGILLSIITYALFFTELPNRYERVSKNIVPAGTIISDKRILLPDSSVVVLSEGASIVSLDDYGQKTRTVRLVGEAFFDIRPNPKVPFLVYTGELVTEVIGTSFTIRPQISKNIIEVFVSSGKVSVYSNGKDTQQRKLGVIITPNQKAIFDTESKKIWQGLVDTPIVVDEQSVESNFYFDEVSVHHVFSRLEDSYGMEIVVQNPELNMCYFTGDLTGFDLFKQLDYVCNVIGGTYEIRGATIFINGEGCRK